MFLSVRETLAEKEEEFSRPVESIMRCEDFKSNFARRLSNRYISRSPVVSSKNDNTLKLPSVNNTAGAFAENVPERIEPSSQLSKVSIMEHCGKAFNSLDAAKTKSSDIQVTGLKMEVETLRWQLAQTEANRQMHIALLKQIVTFLNRVKEHIEYQKCSVGPREVLPARILTPSLNSADLPRSKSVFHVNKSSEYAMSPVKNINSKKISKSISNVNGCKSSPMWSPSKMSPKETENARKISEEMTSLITLANTVLSTKLPDLACTCSDENVVQKTAGNDEIELENAYDSVNLSIIEEDSANAIIVNTILDRQNAYEGLMSFVETKNSSKDYLKPPSTMTCALENDFDKVKLDEKESMKVEDKAKIKTSVEKKNDFNHSNFIEDESGFSSMSSFQEIGIPIISITPPSPCKEVGFVGDISDVLETDKWKTEAIELDKQAVTVFWV